ncbi:MAG TPA: hypothetical protein VIO11_06130, partial [Candidatus Methanoperedens sp.]
MKLISTKELEDLRGEIMEKKDPNKTCIAVCGGPGCLARQCLEVRDAFVREISAKDLGDRVDIRTTG